MSLHPDIAAVLAGESEGAIVHGDCLSVMADMPDGCVDLVCTDPPYPGMKGGTKHKGLGGVGVQRQESATIGDEWLATTDWVSNAWRVARFGLQVFCSYHSVDCWPSLVPGRVALLTWHKRNSPNPVNNVPKFTTEFIWCFKKTPGLRWSALTTTMYDIPNITAGCVSTGERFVDSSGRAIHPAQKPLLLMERLLAVGGALVFDPYAGLGTTCVAAKKLGRKWIGIEISEKYCEIARNRIKNTPRPLFPNSEQRKKPADATLFAGDAE